MSEEIDWDSPNTPVSPATSESDVISFEEMTKDYVETGEWRSCAVVAGGGNYEVNDLGEVRHIVRKKPLGHYTKDGYKQVSLGRDSTGKGCNYRVNRLVWRIFCDTEIPDELDIDHINRVKTDNRLSNLRPITSSNNNYNQGSRGVSQFKGICWHKQKNKWLSNIKLDAKLRHIGYFKEEVEGARVFDYIRKLFQPKLVADYEVTTNGLDTAGLENHPQVIRFISRHGHLLDNT